jgi:hypothetical protein
MMTYYHNKTAAKISGQVYCRTSKWKGAFYISSSLRKKRNPIGIGIGISTGVTACMCQELKVLSLTQ